MNLFRSINVPWHCLWVLCGGKFKLPENRGPEVAITRQMHCRTAGLTRCFRGSAEARHCMRPFNAIEGER